MEVLYEDNHLIIVNKNCSEIVQGGNLYQYTIKHGLSYNSVRDWISADSDRDAKYARAREDRSDKLADEII